jgi:hypothetical protein
MLDVTSWSIILSSVEPAFIENLLCIQVQCFEKGGQGLCFHGIPSKKIRPHQVNKLIHRQFQITTAKKEVE